MLENILIYLGRLPIVLICLVIHEYAHGFISYKLGDPTAKAAGRLTLNPLSHIDPIGLIMMILFRFGWAKPVPIDPRYYKNKKSGTILVSLAGPFSNLIFGFALTIIYVFIGTQFPVFFNNYAFVAEIFGDFIFINISLCAFNLIPIPPLDGSRVLTSLLPYKWALYVYKYERITMLVLFVLIWLGVLTPFLSWAVNAIFTGFLNIALTIFNVH